MAIMCAAIKTLWSEVSDRSLIHHGIFLIYLYNFAIYSCTPASILLKDWILFVDKVQWVTGFTATY